MPSPLYSRKLRLNLLAEDQSKRNKSHIVWSSFNTCKMFAAVNV